MHRIFMLAIACSAVCLVDAAAQTTGTGGAQVSEITGQFPGTSPPTITTAQPVPGSPVFVNLTKVSNDYQVGPGDLLEVQVIGHEDLNQTLRISNSGEISYPMLGLIRVADMSVFDVEKTIGDELRAKQLLKDPQVLVFIREYQAKPLYVSGAVVTPGEFVMSQELTVAEAILLAGGLMFNAADEGLIHRRVTPEARRLPAATVAENPDVPRPGVELIKIDLRPFKQGKFLDGATPLKPGDVLVVPQMRMNAFYVAGEVIDPRNFFYQPGKTLMASQAISWAGGPTQTAKMSDGMLVRIDESGKRSEMKVDYAALLRGKAKDFPIQPNDIIFIPGSKVKTIAQGMLLLSDTMVMSASFRVARSYQMPSPADRPVPQVPQE